MSPHADDRQILSEIEQGLIRDDPHLASLFGTLDPRVPQKPEPESGDEDVRPRRDRRVVVAIVLAVIAILALLLTMIWTASPAPPADDTGPGPLTLSASVSTTKV
ncbi:DUF3040 domain-containing protein [Streptomyces sp. NPDC056527]|uniref:DUF3040 domain-containing protein n=1 Tax=Streptomyces sp. NPDC056527 TaxID=3345853 RepID=UPI00368DA304